MLPARYRRLVLPERAGSSGTAYELPTFPGIRNASDKTSDNQRKKSSVKRLLEVFCCCCGWCPDLGFLLRLALVCPDYRGRAAAGT